MHLCRSLSVLWHCLTLGLECLWCPESLAEVWVSCGLMRAGCTECSSVFMGPFEGGHRCLHYLNHSLVSGQTTGREHSLQSTENWIKDTLSMALPIRTRLSFPHSEPPPSGSFHRPLILIHQRTERMKTTITEN